MSAAPAEGPADRTWFPRRAAAKIGVARCDITPQVGIRARSWGAARGDLSTGVHMPITATAMCIADDQGLCFLVTLDLGGLRPSTDAAIRQRVCDTLGIGADDLLLHCIHTHAGPCCALEEAGLPGGALVPGYLADMTEKVVDMCVRARDAAVNATVTWAYGHCDLAVIRDLPCGTRYTIGFNADAPADDTVAVGRISGPDGTIIGVLLNYACHPTTLAWENSLLSPDYVGAARQTVEDATGALCLFLQGASGDLSPRYQYVGDTAVADRHGRTLGYATLSTLESMEPAGTALHFDGVVESGAELAIWKHVPDERPSAFVRLRGDVPMELKPLPTAQQAAARWKGIDPVAAGERVARAQQLQASYDGASTATHPFWMWQLGDGVLVAHPGEAYSSMQIELRRRHPDRVLLVLNLTNLPGRMYLPNAEAYPSDRYQTWQTLYRPGALEALIDGTHRALATLPDGRGDPVVRDTSYPAFPVERQR